MCAASSLQEMITLVVGEGKKETPFTIHKDILCKASPFFKAACKPEWMRAEDKVIKLPVDDPKVIQMMIYWIYHNEICVVEGDLDWDDYSCEAALESAWGLFAKLYVLGKKYQMPRLQVDAVDAILALHRIRSFPVGLIPWVYKIQQIKVTVYET